jgi:hypothetical protein
MWLALPLSFAHSWFASSEPQPNIPHDVLPFPLQHLDVKDAREKTACFDEGSIFAAFRSSMMSKKKMEMILPGSLCFFPSASGIRIHTELLAFLRYMINIR